MKGQLFHEGITIIIHASRYTVQKRSGVFWHVIILVNKGKLHNLCFILPPPLIKYIDYCLSGGYVFVWFFPLYVAGHWSHLPHFFPPLYCQILSEVWQLPRPCSPLWCRLCCRWGLKPAWWRAWSRRSTFWRASSTLLYLTWSVTYCRRSRRTDRGGHRAEVTVWKVTLLKCGTQVHFWDTCTYIFFFLFFTLLLHNNSKGNIFLFKYFI